jgi:hypothetical protein
VNLNISYLIHHLLNYYKNPPKFAKNYIQTLYIRIDLDYLNRISDEEFLNYFCSKVDKQEFMLYTPDYSKVKQID